MDVEERVKRFGAKLQDFIYSERVFALLGDKYSSWAAGGCWILAQALLRWIGSDRASLVAVTSPRNPVEHVVVRVGPWYLDADGVSREPELLKKMEMIEQVPEPWLSDFDPKAVGDIECPLPIVRKVHTALLDRFGSASSWI